MRWSVAKVKHAMEFSANFQWGFALGFWEFVGAEMQALQVLQGLYTLSFHFLRWLFSSKCQKAACLPAPVLSEYLSPLCNQRESSHHLKLFLMFSMETPK